MAQCYTVEFIFLTLLFSVTTKEILGKRNNNYDEYGLESDTVCYIGPNPLQSRFPEFDKLFGIKDKKHTLKMSSTKNSGIIVKANHIFDRWTSVISDKYCRFYVKAPKGHGLFGVIQKLSFRHNGSQCLDYVQFRRKDEGSTKQFCGQIDHGNTKYYSNTESEDSTDIYGSLYSDIYAEYDTEGYLETTIFISKENLLSGQTLDVSIVYTPYKGCKETESNEYKRVKVKGDHEICLREETICDGFQNCPPNLCSDEADCYDSINNIIISNGTGTKVTIGAVTTIFLCFITFVVCLWMCKKYKKLYWSSDCAGPVSCAEDATHMPGQVPETSEATNNGPVPTAPMLEVAESPVGVNKDLPPSYESLFPEQRIPATS